MKIHTMLCVVILGGPVFLCAGVGPSSAAPPSHTPKGGSQGGCGVNMIEVGPTCVDKYEASVWSEAPLGNGAPQGQQFGATSDDYPCSDNGNDCSAEAANPIYAASVPGVRPSASITWFQAQQACGNVGKRLLRNAEWQMAAAGTPDTGGADDGLTTCNTDNLVPGVSSTGSRSHCVSNWDAFDMVGNVWEWVEDWIQPNTADGATLSTPLYGGDGLFGINDAPNQTGGAAFPAALIRGGRFAGPAGFTGAGVFTLSAQSAPSDSFIGIGFRCGR